MVTSIPPIRDDDGNEHSAAAYKAGRCRCQVCKDEWAAQVTAYRRRTGVKPRPDEWGDMDKNHGTRSRYTSGCRCDRCREANRTYSRERYKARKGE